MKNLLVITLLFSSFGLHSQSIILDCESEKESPETGMDYTKIEILQFKSGGTVMFNNFPITIDSIGQERIWAEREYGVRSFPHKIKLQINRMSNDVWSTHFIKEFGKDEWRETVMRYHNCKLR